MTSLRACCKASLTPSTGVIYIMKRILIFADLFDFEPGYLYFISPTKSDTKRIEFVYCLISSCSTSHVSPHVKRESRLYITSLVLSVEALMGVVQRSNTAGWWIMDVMGSGKLFLSPSSGFITFLNTSTSFPLAGRR